MAEQPVLQIVLLQGATAPSYQTEGAAGMDLHANVEFDVYIHSGEYAKIPTGVRLAIPEGYEGQVRPRSGLADKYGISLVNSPGTIDADFRGELSVLLINHGKGSFRVSKGDRIAQLVITPCVRARLEQVTTLPPTERGSGGFGSTGV